MWFYASTSGRACLIEWETSLAVSDIVSLLGHVKAAAATARARVILIVAVRKDVPRPGGYVVRCLEATLPAILDGCQELVVALEGNESDRASLRGAFQTRHSGATMRTPTRLFDTLGAAFGHAQSASPHDVLELQRLVMRRSFPTASEWT
jgi:hypothetical protein